MRAFEEVITSFPLAHFRDGCHHPNSFPPSLTHATCAIASRSKASLRAIASGQRVPSKEAILLMDSTRARRWGHRRRLVLNDRILTSAPKQARHDVSRFPDR